MKASTSRGDDSGVSLIELIVVVVLLGIMGSIIATIFINSWRTQDTVATTTQATNEGQFVGQSIERAVRNGVAVSPTNGGASKLLVRTPYTDSRHCQVFWVSADGKLYMAEGTTGSTLSSPSPWAANVSLPGGSPAPTTFFQMANGTVTYGFNLGTAAAPVTIQGSVAMRSAGGDGGDCW